MDRHGFRLGSVFGFEIRIDASWFVIFVLLWWSLGAGVFPAATPGGSPLFYAVLGLIATLLFFASLLGHELAHSLVARRRGIPVSGITLFIFGGMAHATLEPGRPEDELAIAGIGPIVSLALGLLFLGAAGVGRAWGWSGAVNAIAAYLGTINILLAIFNLLPGFPLDGGRVFRALAWWRTGDPARATRWATTGGRWIGWGLVAAGVIEALAGGLLGGVWLVFIGLFLRAAADQALRQYRLQAGLQGAHASDVMSTRVPPQVEADMALDVWIRDSLLRSRATTAFPVVEGGRVIGVVSIAQVEATPHEIWSSSTVRDVMTSIDEAIVVAPEAEMTEVLAKMQRTRQVLVMDHERLLGFVSPIDIAARARRARLVASAA